MHAIHHTYVNVFHDVSELQMVTELFKKSSKPSKKLFLPISDLGIAHDLSEWPCLFFCLWLCTFFQSSCGFCPPDAVQEPRSRICQSARLVDGRF